MSAAKKRKQAWSDEEDEQLRKLVKLYGTKWVKIAAAMSRPNEACRLRWVHAHDPDTINGPFSEWEQAVVVLGQRAFGNSWSTIARMLHGRTPYTVKNHWHNTLVKRLAQGGDTALNNNKCLNTPGITLHDLLLNPPALASAKVRETAAAAAEVLLSVRNGKPVQAKVQAATTTATTADAQDDGDADAAPASVPGAGQHSIKVEPAEAVPPAAAAAAETSSRSSHSSTCTGSPVPAVLPGGPDGASAEVQPRRGPPKRSSSLESDSFECSTITVGGSTRQLSDLHGSAAAGLLSPSCGAAAAGTAAALLDGVADSSVTRDGVPTAAPRPWSGGVSSSCKVPSHLQQPHAQEAEWQQGGAGVMDSFPAGHELTAWQRGPSSSSRINLSSSSNSLSILACRGGGEQLHFAMGAAGGDLSLGRNSMTSYGSVGGAPSGSTAGLAGQLACGYMPAWQQSQLPVTPAVGAAHCRPAPDGMLPSDGGMARSPPRQAASLDGHRPPPTSMAAAPGLGRPAALPPQLQWSRAAQQQQQQQQLAELAADPEVAALLGGPGVNLSARIDEFLDCQLRLLTGALGL